MGTVRIGVLGFSVSLMACGGSTTQEDDTGSDEQLCASAEVGSGQAATGLIYTDSDGSDRSSYLAAFDSSDQGIGGADLKLIGADGNAFAIMGAVTRALRGAGYTNEEIHEYQAQCMSGDYNNLLVTSMKWVDVE